MIGEGCEITNERKSFCKEYADACIKFIEEMIQQGKYVPNGLNNLNLHYEGCLGEGSLRHLFTINKVPNTWTLPKRKPGIGDGGIDFVVNNINIDVKYIPPGRKLFIVNQEDIEHNSDFYVGFQDDGRDYCYFRCWFTKEEVLKFKTTDDDPYYKKKFIRPAYMIRLDNVEDMYRTSFAQFLKELGMLGRTSQD